MTPFTPTFPTMPTTNNTGIPIQNLNSSVTIEASDRGTPTLLDADITLPQGFVGLAAMTAFATITISGLEAGDSLTVDSGLPTGWRPGTGNTLLAPTGITASATVSQTGGTVTISLTSAGFVASAVETLIESLRFSTTDASVSGSRTLNIFVDTSNMDLSGTVGVTLAAAPVPVQIEGLEGATIPFETRFVRNLIDGDITLPADMVKDLDEGIWSLNGRTLSITGLQFGDAIRFAEGSGFTFAFGPSGVTLNGQPFATATGNTSSASFTVTTNVTAAQLEQFLESLTFQAGPANPAQTSRTLSYSLNSPTPLTGSAAITLAAPLEQNQIQDLDNQTVFINSNSVRIDSAITLSDAFIAAYSSDGLLNNSTVSVTGWTGLTAPIRFASGTGVSVEVQAETLHWISVDGVRVGAYNPFNGTISLNSNATAATVETLIEAISINPQLTTQTPTRTITVTVVTPTLPQHGTVTFTGANVALNDLRETVDVSFADASYGVYLDTDVTLLGAGDWGGGKIEVTGLAEGDLLIPANKADTSFYFDDESGIIMGNNFIPLGTLTGDAASGVTITLEAGVSQTQVEKIIESLFLLVENAGGPRTLEIKVTDGTGAVAKDTITVNVGYTPTLTDMVDTLDLTAAQAAAGQVLDADVTFKGDSDLEYGGVFISGLKAGDVIDIRTDGESPISFERIPNTVIDNIVINGRTVGTFYPNAPNGPEIGLRADTTGADVEAILENLVFRTTGTDPTRDITITIRDTDGYSDTQVVTVNILPPGSKEVTYEILQNVNGTLVTVEGGAGTTSDLNPADLFGNATPPDEFVVQYSGVLNQGGMDFSERSIISFGNVAPGTVLIVNGVSYPLVGPEGRLALDLAPGLHKFVLQVPYETNMGQIVTTPPTLTFGAAVPPAAGEPWPDFDQTPLLDNVRTVPETLYRVEVTTTITIGFTPSVQTHVFYMTSLENVPAQLDALRAQINPPAFALVEQGFTSSVEVTGTVGADTLNGTDVEDLLEGGAGDDLLMGSLGADTLDGGTGANTLSYEGSNVGVTVDLAKGVGQGGHANGDVIRNIQAVIGSAFADNLIGGAGNDSLYGGAGRDTLTGNAGDDLLVGGLGNDSVVGGAGNDLLRGFTGADTLLGGEGNDVLVGGLGADMLDGGAGVNRASYAVSDAAVSVNLQTGVGAGGHAEGDRLLNIREVLGSGFGDTLTGSTRIDVLRGEDGDDIIQGGRGADRLFGGVGDDQLSGGDGNDLLAGDLGADTIDGGRGVDTLSYAASSSGVDVDLSKGAASGGAAEGDVILNVERVIGSAFSDNLTGGQGAETLEGGADEDFLDGGAGNDLLIGGDGVDTFIFKSGFGSDRIADLSTEDKLSVMPELWGSVSYGDVLGLLDAVGHQLDGYVELRLTETDILRIDGITLEQLRDRPDYFALG